MIMSDMVIACTDLARRSGAKEFQLGFVHDDVPVEEAGWYAQVCFQGGRIIAQDHRSPEAAALALATRLLTDAMCRCGRPVSLSDGAPGCRWMLVGQRWKPSCDVPPIKVRGKAGDLAAMRRAMEDTP
jgi:hypothetical protein